MLQTTPIASASPNGDFSVIRRFRWIPEHKLAEIERIEEAHRMSRIQLLELIELLQEDERLAELARLEAQPICASGRHPLTVGSRRAVILKFGGLTYRGHARATKSRLRSRAKARRRDRRTIRQLPLAA